MMFGLLGSNSSSRAACASAPLASRKTSTPTGRFSGIFSTFEQISLTPDSCMQKNDIPMLYERASSQLPTLYVCPVENVLGRVPLIQCFLNGNKNNTIPHSLRYEVPDGAAADSRHDSGTGSRLF